MQSPTIGKLAVALATAQLALKPAEKDGENPHFGSEFATLASIWEACRKPLAENKLAVIQGVDAGTEGKQAIFWTTLVHESGEWIRSEMPFILSKQDPQGVGSAVTYYRRYFLAAIVGVTQDDDDGNAAMGSEKKKEEKKSAAQGSASGSKPNATEQDVTDAIALMESAVSLAALKIVIENLNRKHLKFSKEQLDKIEMVKNTRKAEFAEAKK